MTGLLKRALRVAGIAALGLVIAWAAAYVAVFRELGAVVTAQVSYYGVPMGFAQFAGWLIAIAATGLFLRLGLRLTLGQVTGIRLVGLVAAGLGLVLALQLMRHDWLFDESGKPLYHICPGVIPGDPPRLQGAVIDRLTGQNCPAVDRSIASVVLLIRRGRLPEPLSITTTTEFDGLLLQDERNGAGMIFEGVPAPNGDPRLYRHAGFDPYAYGSALVRPLSERRAVEIRARLVSREEQQRRDADARKAAARAEETSAAHRLAVEAARLDREQRRAATQALRRAMVALQVQERSAGSVITPTTVETSAQPEAIAARWITSMPQAFETSVTADAGRFFHTDPVTPKRIYFFARPPAMSGRQLERIVTDLALGQELAPSTQVAAPAFYDSLDLHALVVGDYRSLRNVAFPAGLGAVLIVDTITPYSLTPPHSLVRWIEFDLAAKQAFVHQRLICLCDAAEPLLQASSSTASRTGARGRE